jgi:hypothetical protein
MNHEAERGNRPREETRCHDGQPFTNTIDSGSSLSIGWKTPISGSNLLSMFEAALEMSFAMNLKAYTIPVHSPIRESIRPPKARLALSGNPRSVRLQKGGTPDQQTQSVNSPI